ncbi:MAG: MipA/OmpV family protein [Pseudomonadota bacterium]
MRRAPHALLSALASLCVAVSAGASAQTPEEIERYKQMTILSVGLAGVFNAEPYVGLDNRVLPIPFFAYNKNNLTVGGPNVSYRFWRPLGVQLSAETRFRFQAYDADDSPFLEGMEGRNGTLELGMRAQKRWDRLRVRGGAFVDVAGQHDGYQINLQANYEVANGRIASLRPTLGVSYQSQNIINYYYGVRTGEARTGVSRGNGTVSDRPTYFGEEAFIPYAGLEGRFRLSRRLQLAGQARADFLPTEVTDSPIIGPSTRYSAFFGVNYLLSGPGVTPRPGDRR